MSLREAEQQRRLREAEQQRRQNEEQQRRRDERDRALDDDRVMSFREWCELNDISVSTGRRQCKKGEGPKLTQISDRRWGVTVRDNREWQESRKRKGLKKLPDAGGE
jgi:hypothetical protein